MLKYLIMTLVFLFLSIDAMACGGMFAARGVRRAAVRVRSVSFVRPAVAPVTFPVPMPPAIIVPPVKSSADLELRVERMEKAMDAAGRALLFRNAAPSVKVAAPVVVATTPVALGRTTTAAKTKTVTRTRATPFRGLFGVSLFGGCPTGGCP